MKGNGAGDALVFGACLSSGTADGVVESGSVSGTTLTLVRSVGAGVQITGLPETTDSDIDARIATYARATPSGTIATAQLPSANALDSASCRT